jgi:hypothetical protein
MNAAPEEAEQPETDVAALTEPIQNGELISVSGAVVEIVLQITVVNSAGVPVTGPGFCSATLINNNSLVTAAHCSGPTHAASYFPNMQVIYQEDNNTWRCLTNLNASGAVIRGSRSDVLANCAGRTVGFGSMFDFGTDVLTFPQQGTGPDYLVQKHDFAVVKVWTPSDFTWIGTDSTNYAAFYTGTISNGFEWAYGRGAIGQTPYPFVDDGRVRRVPYNVVYSDNFVLGAFGDTGQLCSGDSGGPLGVFVRQPDRFAIVGVANVVADSTPMLVNSPVICSTIGGGTFWSNAVSRVWYVEQAIGLTCSSVNHAGIIAKECWH